MPKVVTTYEVLFLVRGKGNLWRHYCPDCQTQEELIRRMLDALKDGYILKIREKSDVINLT